MSPFLAAGADTLYACESLLTEEQSLDVVRLPDHADVHKLTSVRNTRNQACAFEPCNCSPSAFTTLRIVLKLGFPSLERALYSPSRVIPASRATCAMPRARAMTPSA